MMVFWVSYAALWIIVAIQSFALVEVLRQIGLIRKQLEPQQGALIVPDAVAPGSALPELSGLSAETMLPARWDEYLHARLGIIVCLTAHCTSCHAIADDLTGLAADVRPDATIVALVEGSRDEVQGFIEQTGLDPRLVIIDEGGQTLKRLGVSWNPGAVTVREGRLGEAAIVNSVMQISALIYGSIPFDEKRRVNHGVPA